MATPSDTDLLAWLRRQRWYADGARPIADLHVSTYPVRDGGSDTVVALVRLRYDGGESIYHVPLRRSVDSDAEAVISTDPPWSDALGSEDGAANLLLGLAGDHGPLRGEWLPGRIATDRLRPSRGEQSNSAIIVGDQYFVKVLRRVEPGPNPDVTVGRALRAAGCEHVARYAGSLRLESPDGDLDLVVAHELLTGTDGFTLALGDVDRDRRDLPGEHFPGAAYELGIAVGAVHTDLADAFGAASAPGGYARLGARMLARLDALSDIPELAPYTATARAVFRRVADRSDSAVLHRVHGDLHLGQVVFTDEGWRLVDFEGEPRRPLAERAEPDSPMRDLAGVVRSFDYAARWAGGYPGAADWRDRAVDLFLEGYRLQHPDAYDEDLLDAFVLDKALYEVGYELTYRPQHTGIPLSAVARLCGGHYPQEQSS